MQVHSTICWYLLLSVIAQHGCQKGIQELPVTLSPCPSLHLTPSIIQNTSAETWLQQSIVYYQSTMVFISNWLLKEAKYARLWKWEVGVLQGDVSYVGHVQRQYLCRDKISAGPAADAESWAYFYVHNNTGQPRWSKHTYSPSTLQPQLTIGGIGWQQNCFD